jgi:DNA-binding GntR family transcriptional regulator
MAIADTAKTKRPTRQKTDLPEVILDYGSRQALYYQIAEELRLQIERGVLKPGSLLGNEVQFAVQLAVSRPTVRKAISLLVEQGLVARRRGIGTVVLPNRIKRRLALPSLYEDLESSGKQPSTRVLSLTRQTPEAEMLSVIGDDSAAEMLQIRRLRYADEIPLAIMTNWLPIDLLEVQESDLERFGLYDLLRRAGAVPRVVDETIGARLAGRRDASLLEINSRDAVLTVAVVSYDAGGRAIDVGRHIYRADRYSFETTHVTS